jgi:uncharacterized protein (DUF1697 family)
VTAAGAPPPRGVFVALLRGVNVGGRTLAMARLRTICSDLGYEDVATYIQSGNVVLRADADRAGAIAGELADAIRDHAGLQVAVVVREARRLRAVLEANPFADRDDEGRLHVTFLAGPADGAEIPSAAGAPDEFVPGDGVVYIWCVGGYGRTILNNQFFERRLGVAATTRNWRTVSRLAEMASSLEAGS